LVLQNAPFGSLEIEGLHLRPAGGAGTTAKFDLTLNLEEDKDGLTGTAEYSTDLFDAATIDRLVLHYGRLLAGMAEAPERHVGDLDLLTVEEALQLRAGNEASYPLDRPLHAWIEDQARRFPDAVAVTFEAETLTYGELDRRANRLARHLLALGVGPEIRVAVLMERSTELVVALLAVLKAGGAYVPLDLAYPAERIAFLLEDSAAAVLLTEARLDADREQIEALSGKRLPVVVEPEHIAYVIYTSGSTGRPKGVQVTHANVLRLFAATQERFAFGPADAWTFFHSVAFDFSVWEIWGALIHGGRLVVVPWTVSRSPVLFLDLLVREQVTVLNQTPSAFAQLAQEDETRGGIATDLRLVIFGGEALDLAGLAPWLARHGDEKPLLVNMYGITETTVHVTARPLRAADARGETRSLIGLPIPDLSLTVMDPGLRPVPLGVPGELAVSGAGLARGYLGRPELTAERFVPDPLGETPGARLYRSGDLGRLLARGDVEYLGRIDQQVKIRGFRIELGEIEAALVALDGVREAAVVLREDRLVAYVLGGAEHAVLRAELRERLPDYMVPAAFVRLAALPLTPHGKVDRKALPAPELQSTAESHVAPRSPVEEVLTGLWAELLGLDRAGVTDHFFDLGGHSLLAARVMSRLRSAFGVEMPLRDLFEAPVLKDLAARVDAALRAGAGPAAPPLVPVSRVGPMPLSYPQERLWFLYLLEPESPAFHLGSAVRLTGALAPGALAASLGETVRRHEVLRTRYQESGDGPVQIIDPAAPLPLPLVDLGGLPEGARERELRRLAERELARPFNLTRDWPLRACLVRLSREEHAALFTLHHIAGDGWSLGLLTREVGALYAAFSTGRPPALPEPVAQYADFAVWQRGWLSGERLETELDWWRNRLSGPLPALELPQRRERPETPGFRGAACPLAVPAGLRRSLEKICRSEGATLFMTLLAGFKALLHLETGQEDLLVATNVANRDRGEIEGLIGFFVNNLVLRTSLSGDPGFRELVRRVRDVTLGAFVHQEVPFEKVLEAVHPRRQTAFAPLFQAMFLLDNFPMAAQQAGGLEIAPLELEARTASFDLTLRLREEEGGLSGALQYDTDLFPEAVMERMAEHYLALLHSVAEDPDRPLSALSLTGDSEIRELAGAFNEDF
jgi:amino acid adenylation domain-containing protein